jgi:hypothetical protein
MTYAMKVLGVILATTAALLSALAQSPALLTAFTNPVPSKDDLFGRSVAALGSDRIIIGSSGRTSIYTNPAVYLFTTNSQLLTTFTNPTPTDNTFYGRSVAGVGADRVLIGAYQSGIHSGIERAYLFNTNGALVTTFTRTEGSSFGTSVAALGSERVLIGASSDSNAGLVHLFSTNGDWLNTFTNPSLGGGDGFGLSIAAVGNDRVLIGAPYAADTGAAYLFNTNGTLTATFTDPTPGSGERFGVSVAAFGRDRVLIGAPRDSASATNGGSAYLFDMNGVLLTSFTNPSPAYTSTGVESLDGDFFGVSVAALGSDRVLIGAQWNDAPNGTRYAGTAYVFNTNGTLLATLTNPAPTFRGSFGGAVAAFGSDRVLMGAPAFALTISGTNSGRAYLFSIAPPPSLSIRLTVSNTVAVSWPSIATGFVLERNTNVLGSVSWSNVTDAIQDDGTNRFIIVSPPAGNRFYRLVKP